MEVWGYLLVFVLSFLVDLIPLFAPPAWTAMVICLIAFKLKTWPVLILGVVASTLGRYCMSLYISKLSDRFIKEEANNDLVFIGKKAGRTRLEIAPVYLHLYANAIIYHSFIHCYWHSRGKCRQSITSLLCWQVYKRWHHAGSRRLRG